MIGPVADLLDGYGDAGTWDEMFRDPDEPRPAYRALHDTVLTLSAAEFDERCRLRDDLLRDQGITFSLSGEERPLPLDLVPRIITADEWAVIERGSPSGCGRSRRSSPTSTARGEILADRVVPRRLVTSSTHFQRAAAGIRAAERRAGPRRRHRPRPRRARRFRVLEDNLRTPSGISYVIENRRTMAHVLPRAVRQPPGAAGRRLPDPAPARRCSPPRPPSADDPHRGRAHPRRPQLGLLRARLPGPPDGRRAGRGPRPRLPRRLVWMRTTEGERGGRRSTAASTTTSSTRCSSGPTRSSACAGILNAARAGNVTIANAVGNGVADDKAVYPYVPEMVEYYLGEEPMLPNVPTYDLEDDDQRDARARPARPASCASRSTAPAATGS